MTASLKSALLELLADSLDACAPIDRRDFSTIQRAETPLDFRLPRSVGIVVEGVVLEAQDELTRKFAAFAFGKIQRPIKKLTGCHVSHYIVNRC